MINATTENAGADIPKQPITVIKQADPLKLADAASMFVKMSEENAELKERIAQLESVLDEKAIQAMIEKRVVEIMKKDWGLIVREYLPDVCCDEGE